MESSSTVIEDSQSSSAATRPMEQRRSSINLMEATHTEYSDFRGTEGSSQETQNRHLHINEEVNPDRELSLLTETLEFTREMRPSGSEGMATSSSRYTSLERSQSEIHRVGAQSPSSPFIREPLTPEKIEEIDRQVVELLVKAPEFWDIIFEDSFHAFLNKISECPGNTLPTANVLASLFAKKRAKLTEKLKAKISGVQYVCLSADEWISQNEENFIAISAHFIHKNHISSALMHCFQYYDDEDLYSMLKTVIEDWHLENKVCAIVSDCAADINRVVDLEGWKKITCFGYSLNQIVQKSIADSISLTVNKFILIVNHFNNSCQATSKLRKVQLEMHMIPLKLKQNNATLWTATYVMLERVITIKKALVAALSSICPNLSPAANDWKLIEEATLILKPFYETALELSADKTVRLSKAFVLRKLLFGYLSARAPKTEGAKCLLNKLQEAMGAKFKNIERDQVYAESTILDPRFKGAGFADSSACNDAIAKLKQNLAKISLPTDSNVHHVALVEPTPSKTYNFWASYDAEMAQEQCNHQMPNAMAEVDLYMEQPYLPRSGNPLQWWNDRKETFPRLYQYIQKRLCIVASSVPCEKIFSEKGQMLTENRALLKAEEVSDNVFLHYNL